MNKLNPIVICLILTIAFSIPSTLKIPMMIPFLDSEVRAKAPQAIENLRKEGVWMVNTKLKSVSREGGEICFQFEHSYTSKFLRAVPRPSSLVTCLPTSDQRPVTSDTNYHE